METAWELSTKILCSGQPRTWNHKPDNPEWHEPEDWSDTGSLPVPV